MSGVSFGEVGRRKEGEEVMTENSVCCICKHFRMWKPEKKYCTVKKIVVDPEGICNDYILRKGLGEK